MPKYVLLDCLWTCNTCANRVNGKCRPDVWCECGEAYRPAYDKLTIVEGKIVSDEVPHENN